MNDISQFMLGLAKSPHLQQQFKNDPHGTLTAAGLNNDQIAAVLSRDPSLIQRALGARTPGVAADASDIVIVVVI